MKQLSLPAGQRLFPAGIILLSKRILLPKHLSVHMQELLLLLNIMAAHPFDKNSTILLLNKMPATEQSVPVFLPEEEMGMQDLMCLIGSEEH